MGKNQLTVSMFIVMALSLASTDLSNVIAAESAEQVATRKRDELNTLINQAKGSGIDTAREENSVWIANEFLKYADWDEANVLKNKTQFERVSMFQANAQQLANTLPKFERQEVIKMLDTAKSELTQAINGTITRRTVPKVNWQNIAIQNDQFMSNGKPVFLYDYFSKPLNISTTDPTLYNDHLGMIDHPKAISPIFATDEEGTIDQIKLNDLVNRPTNTAGYVMFWHDPLPEWAINKYGPEIQKGQSIFTKYDIDNPQVREIWKDVLKGTIPTTAGKNFTKLGYILANEPHWFTTKGYWAAIPNVSSYTISKFRTWLQTKHGTIAKLNSLWGTSYSDFGQVNVVIPLDTSYKNTPIWYDWSRFNMDRGTEWLTFLHDEIKKYDPAARTLLKIMPDLFVEEARDHGIDFEALTEMTEIIGDDAKIRKRNMSSTGPESWESKYAYYWEEMAMTYDFMDSVSPNKPHFNSEVHLLSTTQYRDLYMKPEYVRSTYWQTTLHGLNAGLTWFWGRNPDGSIEERLQNASGGLGESYAASVAQQPRVAHELTKTMMDLNAFSDEIVTFQRERKPIRLFYSEAAAINDSDYMSDQFELYESMYFSGVPLGFATKNIIFKQPNSSWDVIVVRKSEEVTEAEFNALQIYLNNGGTVIIDDVSLKFNEYKQPRAKTLTAGTGKLIKLSNNSVQDMTSNAMLELAGHNQLPPVVLTENNGLTSKGALWRVVLNGANTYMMTIVNIGKNSSTISLKMADNKNVTVKDMMTGKSMGSNFTLDSEGVLLLEITPVP
ncbi:beta-galactosidase [Paenibacillus ferrarius]|uniref:beta-galactosidase n=1 Tax=Paenibacillus ferrarius TaxID=1469647 RepID=UPI003D2C5330